MPEPAAAPVEVIRPSFSLRVHADHFEVVIAGVAYFDLSVRSSVDAYEGPEDQDEEVLAPSQCEGPEGPIFEWKTRSSLWAEKRYRLEVYADSFAYRVTVQGQGKLGPVRYFSGARPAYAAGGSDYETSEYLVPAPGGGPDTLPLYRNMLQDGKVELHYLVPSLLALPFCRDQRTGPWLSLGLAPRPGHYNLDHFAYRSAGGWPGKCFFATDYLGYTLVDGEYEVAALVGTVGADEFSALDGYAQWLYNHGGCVRRDWSGSPRWWYGPLFCGWGEQCNLPGSPGENANQAIYEAISDRLDAYGLEPSAIIIDDKWMTTYGEALPDPQKWPDLRGFADAQHRKGRRVMLWFKAWNTEGLPWTECINLWTQPLGTDPNSPAYQERLREIMRRLLGNGPDCYNCDGFKVDFANVMPLGRNLHGTTSAYGLELLQQWFRLFYDAAKAVQPDCLINCSCAHPYFAATTDQCRLHDYCGGLRSAWQVMGYRQRLFRAALPGVLIDTDGVSSSPRETMEYLRRCSELGVPDLYFLAGTEKSPLREEDMPEIRAIWAHYREKLDRELGPDG